MCRALKVLCAAATRERLGEIKRAAVGATWELVGGAASVAALVDQVDELRPDVVVIDESLGASAASAVRVRGHRCRVIGVGAFAEVDAPAALEELRAVILGLPAPGGPVRT